MDSKYGALDPQIKPNPWSLIIIGVKKTTQRTMSFFSLALWWDSNSDISGLLSMLVKINAACYVNECYDNKLLHFGISS